MNGGKVEQPKYKRISFQIKMFNLLQRNGFCKI